MVRRIGWIAALVVAVSAGVAERCAAQGSGSVAAHVENILEAHEGTPEGAGLLEVAIADAEIANEHAGLAGRDPTNIDPMIRHARHVLHALDPAEFAQGPGSGYGLRPAVLAMRAELDAASDAPDASDEVRAAASDAGSTLDEIAASIDVAVSEARSVIGNSDYLRAHGHVEQLQEICAALLTHLEDVRATLAPLAP